MFDEPDLLTAITEYAPYDGPHSADTVRAAADGVAELVRYLNNATGPWNQAATLRHAPTVDSILGRVAAAVYGLDQLFGQLAEALHIQAEDPSLYDDDRDRSGSRTAQHAAGVLRDAQSLARDLAVTVDEARAQTSHLGHDIGGGS